VEMAGEILYASDLDEWQKSIDSFQSHQSTWRSFGLEAEYISFKEKISCTGTYFFHPGMPRIA